MALSSNWSWYSSPHVFPSTWSPGTWAAALALLWAYALLCVILYGLGRAFFLRWKDARKPGAVPNSHASSRSVLLIRPCAGREPRLLSALLSLRGARFSVPLRVRVAVESQQDEAYETSLRACQTLEDWGFDAGVVVTHAQGANPKASQLAAVLEQEAADAPAWDTVMVADSDVDLTAVSLDTLVERLSPRAEDTGPVAGRSKREIPVACAWAPPVEVSSPETYGDKASAALLGASVHSFPILCCLDRSTMVGKLFAVDRRALEQVGGFAAFTECLGEDMELSRRLSALGYGVQAVPEIAPSIAVGRPMALVVQRYARWLAVVRHQRPRLLASYPLLFLGPPFIVLLALCGFHAAPGLAMAAIALSILVRALTAAGAIVLSRQKARWSTLFAATFLADGLLGAAFVRTLVSRRIVWRKVQLVHDDAHRLRKVTG